MWRYNTQRHRTVNDVPYRLVSGQMPQVGLSKLPLLRELIDTLATETQLNKVCDYVGKIVTPDDEEPMVVIDNDGPDDDDRDAEAGFDERLRHVSELQVEPRT